jgi:hypothetical protein
MQSLFSIALSSYDRLSDAIGLGLRWCGPADPGQRADQRRAGYLEDPADRCLAGPTIQRSRNPFEGFGMIIGGRPPWRPRRFAAASLASMCREPSKARFRTLYQSDRVC